VSLLHLEGGTAESQGSAVFLDDPADFVIDAPGDIDVDFQPHRDLGAVQAGEVF
jgi:hypothetical protein